MRRVGHTNLIGYHCNLSIGEAIKSIQFFPYIEMSWYVLIGWLPKTTECLQGGLI